MDMIGIQKLSCSRHPSTESKIGNFKHEYPCEHCHDGFYKEENFKGYILHFGCRDDKQ